MTSEPFHINEDERLDDLQRDGLFVLQKIGAFRFGTDSVLLSAFACEKHARRVFDIGTGCGVIPLLVSSRLKHCEIDALEIQEDFADMAKRSVLYNNLMERIHIYHGDARNMPNDFAVGDYDLVTCNPPYSAVRSSIAPNSQSLAQSTQDVTLNLSDMSRAAARLLRNGGRLCVVVPSSAFLRLCDAAREHRVEPKRVRFVHDKLDKPPYLVLFEAIRNGNAGLHIEPPLIVR